MLGPAAQEACRRERGAGVLTKYRWTVYICGKLWDIMTDEEVEDLIEVYKISRIDSERGLVEFE